jgi:hypothetical protein
MAEGEAAEENSEAGNETVEEVEGPHGAHADEIEQCALDAKVSEGLVQAFVDPIPPAGCGVCLHLKPLTLENGNCCEYGCGCGAPSDAPKPAEDVDSENSDAGPRCYTSQGLLRAWLAMSKLIAADYDGDQAGDFGNRPGEEVLESGESRVEWRPACLGRRDRGEDEKQSEEYERLVSSA